MVRVLVLVEGQTEERFVTDVLVPHYQTKQIFLIPKILTTKTVSYTHLRAHETEADLVCRLLLEKKNQ